MIIPMDGQSGEKQMKTQQLVTCPLKEDITAFITARNSDTCRSCMLAVTLLAYSPLPLLYCPGNQNQLHSLAQQPNQMNW